MVLEHIAAPQHVLAEVHRILAPGSQCFFLEVDNATLRLVPASADIERALELLNRAQIAGGGDPFIGQKLEGLMRRRIFPCPGEFGAR